MIDLNQIKLLKNNHRIGLEYCVGELSGIIICDADSNKWKRGYSDDTDSDWMSSIINLFPGIDNEMECTYEFDNEETLNQFKEICDEIRITHFDSMIGDLVLDNWINQQTPCKWKIGMTWKQGH